MRSLYFIYMNLNCFGTVGLFYEPCLDSIVRLRQNLYTTLRKGEPVFSHLQLVIARKLSSKEVSFLFSEISNLKVESLMIQGMVLNLRLGHIFRKLNFLIID